MNDLVPILHLPSHCHSLDRHLLSIILFSLIQFHRTSINTSKRRKQTTLPNPNAYLFSVKIRNDSLLQRRRHPRHLSRTLRTARTTVGEIVRAGQSQRAAPCCGQCGLLCFPCRAGYVCSLVFRSEVWVLGSFDVFPGRRRVVLVGSSLACWMISTQRVGFGMVGCSEPQTVIREMMKGRKALLSPTRKTAPVPR